MSRTPAMGHEATEALGELLHPRYRLQLTTLNLEGCPIKVSGNLSHSAVLVVLHRAPPSTCTTARA